MVDVREPDEFERSHIPGAVLMPLSGIGNSLAGLPKDRPIVAICLRGRRSAKAARLLRKAGFAEMYSLTGGMLAWPYESARQAPFMDSLLPDGENLWIDHMDLYPFIDRINRAGVPVYLSVGWYDVFTKDAFLWYDNLTVPKRLTVRPLDHSGAEKSSYDLDYGAEARRWFDHWLHRKLGRAPFKNLGLPYHSHFRTDLAPIPAGKPVELLFDILPTSYRFHKGSRLRVTIVCADADNFETPTVSPAPKLRILRDQAHPSYIALPIAEAE